MTGQQLVKLRARPSRDGQTFTYMLDYVDDNGKLRRESLGHGDKRKAEGQRSQRERDLRMGNVVPERMRLSELLADSQERTRGQVRESTLVERDIAMKHLIEAIGDIDVQDVTHRHGETFIQACLDRGNTPATANKKTSGLKRMFELAVYRGQIDKNPFKFIRRVKVPTRKVHVFSDDECARLITAARAPQRADAPDWELLIVTALCTGMRRGELLNTTWPDIDFDRLMISVAPKQDTKQTWEWRIKDSERRALPLTREVADLLQTRRTARMRLHPYVFLSASRYQAIEKRRDAGRWTLSYGRCPVNNFDRGFDRILKRAQIEEGEFHDLRRTCLSRWLTNGLTEYDVMQLAGHSEFSTTHRFYLAVRSDLIDRARAAGMKGGFGAQLARASISV